MLPLIHKIEVQFPADVFLNHVGDHDATRVGQAFKTRGQVHPVPKYVIAFNNDVSEIDPDAKRKGFRTLRFCHSLLPGNCTLYRIDGTLELHEVTVTHDLNNAAVVLSYQGFDEVFSELAEGDECGFFSLTCKA